MSDFYFRAGPDRWWRAFGLQVGFHADGRHRMFSEREGLRKGPPTLRVGRTAEMSICRITRQRP